MATVAEAFALIQDPNFPKLGLSINGKVIENGQHIPKARQRHPILPATISSPSPHVLTLPPPETHATPRLTLPSNLCNPTTTYLILCLDLDAPLTSLPFLSPICHWLQPGLRATNPPDSSGHVELVADGTHYIVDYYRAGPPPGVAPHRYVFWLYEQPEGFDGKKFGQPAEGRRVGVMGRMRWDFAGFVGRARLGGVVAGGWFVSN